MKREAIAFRENLLRIHDYKSGEIEAHMEQLLIYDALFCLEYTVSPYEIDHELRIYQNDDVNIYTITLITEQLAISSGENSKNVWRRHLKCATINSEK